MKVLYLYGFASGPISDKAQFFKKKFQQLGISFQIFDYIPTSQAFSSMRCSNLVYNLRKKVESYEPEQLVLMGSSFGAFIVLWGASLFPKKVKKLILIAPAINFSANFIVTTLGTSKSQWMKNKTTSVEHYRFKGNIPLNYSFYTDLVTNAPPDFSRISFKIPTIIFHGINDDVVPILWSNDFSKLHSSVKMYPLEGDHQLLNQKEKMWELIESSLSELT